MIDKKSAFSLVEALVAAVIFSIVVVGVFVSLSSLKKSNFEVDASYAAARCLQQFLEGFRAKVDARDYDTGKLRAGRHTTTMSSAWTSACPSSIQNIEYVVVLDPGSQGGRRVTATINW